MYDFLTIGMSDYLICCQPKNLKKIYPFVTLSDRKYDQQRAAATERKDTYDERWRGAGGGGKRRWENGENAAREAVQTHVGHHYGHTSAIVTAAGRPFGDKRDFIVERGWARFCRRSCDTRGTTINGRRRGTTTRRQCGVTNDRE